MKRVCLLTLSILLLLTACSGVSPTPSVAVSPEISFEPTFEPSPEESPKPSTAQNIAVREIPMYENLNLGENEFVTVLHISVNRALLAIQYGFQEGDPHYSEVGFSRETRAVVVYDLENNTVLSQTPVSGICVVYGNLSENGYVYSAVEVNQSLNGVMRFEGGASSWEVALSDLSLIDSGFVPMPVILPSGEVAYIENGCFYYLDNGYGKIPRTLSTYVRVNIVSLDGIARTVYEPDTERFLATTELFPYEDGYMFFLDTDDGHVLFNGDANGAEPLFVLSDCRAVYPWWAAVDGGFLVTLGYGNDVDGITSIETVFVTNSGEVIKQDKKKAYFRMSDGQGTQTIAACDDGWRQYLLTVEGTSFVNTRIDIPRGPTNFYSDGAGKIYAYFNFDASDGNLYLIQG